MWVLFFVALYMSGPGAEDPRGFPTAESCAAFKAQVVTFVQKHNNQEPDKIVAYALECVEVKEAPRGSDT